MRSAAAAATSVTTAPMRMIASDPVWSQSDSPKSSAMRVIVCVIRPPRNPATTERVAQRPSTWASRGVSRSVGHHTGDEPSASPRRTGRRVARSTSHPQWGAAERYRMVSSVPPSARVAIVRSQYRNGPSSSVKRPGASSTSRTIASERGRSRRSSGGGVSTLEVRSVGMAAGQCRLPQEPRRPATLRRPSRGTGAFGKLRTVVGVAPLGGPTRIVGPRRIEESVCETRSQPSSR